MSKEEGDVVLRATIDSFRELLDADEMVVIIRKFKPTDLPNIIEARQGSFVSIREPEHNTQNAIVMIRYKLLMEALADVLTDPIVPALVNSETGDTVFDYSRPDDKFNKL